MCAPKGQKLLAQGNALCLRLESFIRPERAKALIELRKILELLPFQGRALSLTIKTKGHARREKSKHLEVHNVNLGWELLPLRGALGRLYVCYFAFI